MQYDDSEHQVVALEGTSVRLRSAGGRNSVVLLPFLLASPEFAVVDGEPFPELEPLGLLDGLPSEVLAAAKEWERHIVEVMTGLPPDAEPGATKRPEYDPELHPLGERDQAKASELGTAPSAPSAPAGLAMPRRGCGGWWISGRCASGRRPGEST
ncbi:hypothetical protein [Actinomadura sp. GTD37]|uniref:hypothetical protein n=1 Tax=Actinomadura sp. GTD37 TaxID=1778030 RepID=UPI0035C12944